MEQVPCCCMKIPYTKRQAAAVQLLAELVHATLSSQLEVRVHRARATTATGGSEEPHTDRERAHRTADAMCRIAARFNRHRALHSEWRERSQPLLQLPNRCPSHRSAAQAVSAKTTGHLPPLSTSRRLANTCSVDNNIDISKPALHTQLRILRTAPQQPSAGPSSATAANAPR